MPVLSKSKFKRPTPKPTSFNRKAHPSKLKCKPGNFQCGASCKKVKFRSKSGDDKYTNCKANVPHGMAKTGLEWLMDRQERVGKINQQRDKRGHSPIAFDSRTGQIMGQLGGKITGAQGKKPKENKGFDWDDYLESKGLTSDQYSMLTDPKKEALQENFARLLKVSTKKDEWVSYLSDRFLTEAEFAMLPAKRQRALDRGFARASKENEIAKIKIKRQEESNARIRKEVEQLKDKIATKSKEEFGLGNDPAIAKATETAKALGFTLKEGKGKFPYTLEKGGSVRQFPNMAILEKFLSSQSPTPQTGTKPSPPPTSSVPKPEKVTDTPKPKKVIPSPQQKWTPAMSAYHQSILDEMRDVRYDYTPVNWIKAAKNRGDYENAKAMEEVLAATKHPKWVLDNAQTLINGNKLFQNMDRIRKDLNLSPIERLEKKPAPVIKPQVSKFIKSPKDWKNKPTRRQENAALIIISEMFGGSEFMRDDGVEQWINRLKKTHPKTALEVELVVDAIDKADPRWVLDNEKMITPSGVRSFYKDMAKVLGVDLNPYNFGEYRRRKVA